jgi:hypothetical protein
VPGGASDDGPSVTSPGWWRRSRVRTGGVLFLLIGCASCFAGGRYAYSKPEAAGAMRVSSTDHVTTRWPIPWAVPAPADEIRMTIDGNVPLAVWSPSEHGERAWLTVGPLLPIIPNPFAWGAPWCDRDCDRQIHVVLSIGPASGLTCDPREIAIDQAGTRRSPAGWEWGSRWDCRNPPRAQPPATPPIAFEGRADVSVFFPRVEPPPAEFVLHVGGLRRDGIPVAVPPIRFETAGTLLLYAWAP